MKRLIAVLLAAALPAWGAREFVAASQQLGERTHSGTIVPPFTIAAWVRPNNSPIGSAIALGSSANDIGRHILFCNGNNQTPTNAIMIGSVADSGTSQNSSTTALYTPGQWSHAGAVVASTVSRTPYLNGVAGTTGTTSLTTTNTSRISVGARWYGGTNGYGTAGFFDGAIAESAVWNVALSTAEMLSLSKGACPITVRPAALIFYAPMHGEASPEQNLPGASLTLSNAPTKATSHPRIYKP